MTQRARDFYFPICGFLLSFFARLISALCFLFLRLQPQQLAPRAPLPYAARIMIAIILSIVIACPSSNATASLDADLSRRAPATLMHPADHGSQDHFEVDLSAAPTIAITIQHAPSSSPSPFSPSLSSSPSSPQTQPSKPFGAADTSYWSINFGVGADFDERAIGRLGLGVGYFIADNVSLDADFAIAYVDQPEDNPVGFNVALLLRWHFLTDDEHQWSLYGEAGAGLLASTDDIPEHGTNFNFTPQLGAGFSFDLGESFDRPGARLFAGVRWFHISNANTFEDNPAVDFTMIHATLAFPF